MDFKGWLPCGAGRCHPLTITDDYSRFNVGTVACANERLETVRGHLIATYERYGLPEEMLMDYGAPWGNDARFPHTRLTACMMRLGIYVSHGKPRHPQTQGKGERYHRTLLLMHVDEAVQRLVASTPGAAGAGRRAAAGGDGRSDAAGSWRSHLGAVPTPP